METCRAAKPLETALYRGADRMNSAVAMVTKLWNRRRGAPRKGTISMRHVKSVTMAPRKRLTDVEPSNSVTGYISKQILKL